MGVSSLPETVTRQRRDCDLNPARLQHANHSVTEKTENSEMAHFNRVTVTVCPNPGSRTQPQPAIDHYDAVSTFHDDDFC